MIEQLLGAFSRPYVIARAHGNRRGRHRQPAIGASPGTRVGRRQALLSPTRSQGNQPATSSCELLPLGRPSLPLFRNNAKRSIFLVATAAVGQHSGTFLDVPSAHGSRAHDGCTTNWRGDLAPCSQRWGRKVGIFVPVGVQAFVAETPCVDRNGGTGAGRRPLRACNQPSILSRVCSRRLFAVEADSGTNSCWKGSVVYFYTIKNKQESDTDITLIATIPPVKGWNTSHYVLSNVYTQSKAWRSAKLGQP